MRLHSNDPVWEMMREDTVRRIENMSSDERFETFKAVVDILHGVKPPTPSPERKE